MTRGDVENHVCTPRGSMPRVPERVLGDSGNVAPAGAVLMSEDLILSHGHPRTRFVTSVCVGGGLVASPRCP